MPIWSLVPLYYSPVTCTIGTQVSKPFANTGRLWVFSALLLLAVSYLSQVPLWVVCGFLYCWRARSRNDEFQMIKLASCTMRSVTVKPTVKCIECKSTEAANQRRICHLLKHEETPRQSNPQLQWLQTQRVLHTASTVTNLGQPP